MFPGPEAGQALHSVNHGGAVASRKGVWGLQAYNSPDTPDLIPLPASVFRKPVRQNANVVCGSLLIMYALMFTLPYLQSTVMGMLGVSASDIPRLYVQFLEIGCYVLYSLLPALCVKFMTGIPVRVAFPMRAPGFGVLVSGLFFCLGISVIGQMVSVYLYTFVQWLTGIASGAATVPVPQNAAEMGAYIAFNTLLPAVLEEMLFRGVILQSLRRFGDGFALAVSSILFGLCHGNFIQTPNAILMGVAIGYFVLRTGSLLTGMVIHFVNNALAITATIVGVYEPEAAAVISQLTLPAFILLGIIGLIWTTARHGVPLRVMPSSYPLPEWRKYVLFFTSGMAVLFVAASIVLLFRLYTVFFYL